MKVKGNLISKCLTSNYDQKYFHLNLSGVICEQAF